MQRLLLAACFALAGCGEKHNIEFVDVTAQAGIGFRHNSGAFGKKYLPETLGSGACFLDYDDDGWQDLLIVNSASFSALYRNNRDGTFTDVTRDAGLEVEMYGLGCAVGDYDNDGFIDLFVCVGTGPSRLFRNRGDGTFEDVAAKAGVLGRQAQERDRRSCGRSGRILGPDPTRQAPPGDQGAACRQPGST